MENKTFMMRLAKTLEMPAAEATEAVEALARTLAEMLTDDCAVAIAGFGTFRPSLTEETEVVDETSGKTILMPPKIEVKFESSSMLRKRIR